MNHAYILNEVEANLYIIVYAVITIQRYIFYTNVNRLYTVREIFKALLLRNACKVKHLFSTGVARAVELVVILPRSVVGNLLNFGVIAHI